MQQPSNSAGLYCLQNSDGILASPLSLREHEPEKCPWVCLSRLSSPVDVNAMLRASSHNITRFYKWGIIGTGTLALFFRFRNTWFIFMLKLP